MLNPPYITGMNIQLTGKRALVCGSSQGIGKAIAIALSHFGASVTPLARNPVALDSVKAMLTTGENQHHHVLVADFNRPDNLKAVRTVILLKSRPFISW